MRHALYLLVVIHDNRCFDQGLALATRGDADSVFSRLEFTAVLLGDPLSPLGTAHGRELDRLDLEVEGHIFLSALGLDAERCAGGVDDTVWNGEEPAVVAFDDSGAGRGAGVALPQRKTRATAPATPIAMGRNGRMRRAGWCMGSSLRLGPRRTPGRPLGAGLRGGTPRAPVRAGASARRSIRARRRHRRRSPSPAPSAGGESQRRQPR